GRLVSQHRHLMEPFAKDGLQIEFSDDGACTQKHYDQGVLDGLAITTKDGRVLSLARYDHGEKIGRWFKTDEQTGDVTFGRHDTETGETRIFRVSADLIKIHNQGMPDLPESLLRVKRQLPAT